jgi:hypothetical protein
MQMNQNLLAAAAAGGLLALTGTDPALAHKQGGILQMDEHDIIYFFRRRLALATARLCQGPSTEAIDALPPLEISLSPDVAAAMAFSRTMRWYSTGEHLF